MDVQKEFNVHVVLYLVGFFSIFKAVLHDRIGVILIMLSKRLWFIQIAEHRSVLSCTCVYRFQKIFRRIFWETVVDFGMRAMSKR